MAKRQQSDIRRWALVGAEQRLLELATEAAAIHRAFPELRGRARFSQRGAGQGPAASTQAAGGGNGRRRRRGLSAEGRKRISDAQKARWAKQRALKGAAGEGARKRK